MRKEFLKFGLLLVIALTTTTMISSCSSDDDDVVITPSLSQIKVSNIDNANEKTVTVKATGEAEEGEFEIATADYAEEFTLNLPETLEAKYLNSLEFYDIENVEVSDEEVKLSVIQTIYGIDEEDSTIGEFYYELETEDSYYAVQWIYSDRDVTITGSEVEEEEEDETREGDDSISYNLDLKKGWNTIYITFSNNEATVASAKPEIEFVWSFDSYELEEEDNE